MKQNLTTREHQILNLLRKGKSNIQIANEIGISYQTVKNHMHVIFVKLGVTNRVAAAISKEDKS